MKVDLGIKCQFCECPMTAITVGTRAIDWLCKSCNRENRFVAELDFTIGYQIIIRAEREYRDEDFTLAIVLSAMALDAELSRLFVKWTRIEQLPTSELVDVEGEIRRRFRGVRGKIEGIAEMLDPRGLDDFVRASQFGTQINQAFPSLHLGTLAVDVEKLVFWPRNSILHFGNTRFGDGDAAKAWSVSMLMLRVFTALDHERRKLLSEP